MHTLKTSLSLPKLCLLLARQLSQMWPDSDCVESEEITPSAKQAMLRLEHCFSRINNKYFFDGTHVVFDHLHGDQYAMWLYFLSHQLRLDGAPESWSKKIFLLNKLLHGCDIFYEVNLPSIFLLVHPVGTVLGRGTYQDYFICYQRCGIGSNHDIYPSLGRHVTLRPGSAILGSSQIGDNVTIATESLVIDHNIPANTNYFGNPKNHWSSARNLKETIWRT